MPETGKDGAVIERKCDNRDSDRGLGYVLAIDVIFCQIIQIYLTKSRKNCTFDLDKGQNPISCSSESLITIVNYNTR